MKYWIFFLILPVLASCSAIHSQTRAADVSAVNIGKRIIVEGWAVNRKIGAQLIGTNFNLWIDGLSSWPEAYYTGGDKGKKVRISGILAEDNGLPIFIPRKDEPVVQGIPAPEGTDLQKASHRYVLRDASWELLPE